MSKKTSIQDIATYLKVNISTVSRALSNHKSIPIATKLKVQEAAKLLNYTPDLRARSLRTKQSKLIALILPDINMYFIPSLISGVQEVLEKNNYTLLVLTSHNNKEKELELIQSAVGLGVDAILISSTYLSFSKIEIEYLTTLNCPIAFVDKIPKDKNLSLNTISANDSLLSEKCTAYLIQKGHTKILGLFGHSGLQISQKRKATFEKLLKQKNLLATPHLSIFLDDFSNLETLILEAIHKNKVTAIFIMSDEILIEVHRICVSHNIKIPKSISIISISDGILPQNLFPKYTYCHHSGLEVGKLAAKVILECIESQPTTFKDYYIPIEIIENDSVLDLTNSKN